MDSIILSSHRTYFAQIDIDCWKLYVSEELFVHLGYASSLEIHVHIVVEFLKEVSFYLNSKYLKRIQMKRKPEEGKIMLIFYV